MFRVVPNLRKLAIKGLYIEEGELRGLPGLCPELDTLYLDGAAWGGRGSGQGQGSLMDSSLVEVVSRLPRIVDISLAVAPGVEFPTSPVPWETLVIGDGSGRHHVICDDPDTFAPPEPLSHHSSGVRGVSGVSNRGSSIKLAPSTSTLFCPVLAPHLQRLTWQNIVAPSLEDMMNVVTAVESLPPACALRVGAISLHNHRDPSQQRQMFDLLGHLLARIHRLSPDRLCPPAVVGAAEADRRSRAYSSLSVRILPLLPTSDPTSSALARVLDATHAWPSCIVFAWSSPNDDHNNTLMRNIMDERFTESLGRHIATTRLHPASADYVPPIELVMPPMLVDSPSVVIAFASKVIINVMNMAAKLRQGELREELRSTPLMYITLSRECIIKHRMYKYVHSNTAATAAAADAAAIVHNTRKDTFMVDKCMKCVTRGLVRVVVTPCLW